MFPIAVGLSLLDQETVNASCLPVYERKNQTLTPFSDSHLSI